MADRISAVDMLFAAGHAPAGSDAFALAQVKPASLVLVQCWPGSAAQAARALAEIAGVKPGAPGHAAGGKATTVMTLTAGRWLLQSSKTGLYGTLTAKLPAKHATAVDLGHARTVLSVEGEAAARVLNTGMPVDLDPSAFPPGQVAQSLFHHIDVTVRCIAARRYEIMCMRSFGHALFEALCDAAEPYGA